MHERNRLWPWPYGQFDVVVRHPLHLVFLFFFFFRMTGLMRFLSFADRAPDWISRIKRITNKLSTVESIGHWSLDLYVIRINPVHGRRKIAFPLYTWNSFLFPSIFLLHSRPASLPKIPLRGYSLFSVHFLLWSVLNRTRYRRNSIVTDDNNFKYRCIVNKLDSMRNEWKFFIF